MVGKITTGSSKSDSQEEEALDTYLEGLTYDEVELLAQKVYDLMREELRIENERQGAIGPR